MNQLLTDGIISLRAPEPYDLPTIYGWENDTTLWDCGNATAPFSKDMIAKYIATYNPDIYATGQLRLMVTVDSATEPVGSVDLFEVDVHNRRAGVGIIIGQKHRRQGYGLRSLNLVAEYCNEMLGMHQLWATIAADNTGSLALFEKAGFKICGRMRSWLRRGKQYNDAYFLQLLFS